LIEVDPSITSPTAAIVIRSLLAGVGDVSMVAACDVSSVRKTFGSQARNNEIATIKTLTIFTWMWAIAFWQPLFSTPGGHRKKICEKGGKQIDERF
jgi:hypothetical protein